MRGLEDEPPPIPESIAAYSAGIFDGEGNVHIGVYRPKSRHPGYRLQIQVVNSNAALLQWLQRQWGGHIYEMRSAGRNPRWAACFSWSLNKHYERRRFLNSILPYAIVKRRAIAIALDFLKTRPHIGCAASPTVIARRHELFKELRGALGSIREVAELPECIQVVMELV